MTLSLARFDARELSDKELASHIQYTLVKPDATRGDMLAHLETCAEYGFDAAMIPMCWVTLGREVLRGTGIKVATCIGLGIGNESLHGKIALIRECVALGADEIDYEPNMSYYLSGMYDEFREEAAELVKAAMGHPIKAMLEFGYLKTDEHKRRAARLLDEGGLPWVKNSSGWGPGAIPATAEDIHLLRETVSERCRVKASGRVNSYEKAVAIFDAGAELIGTSAGPAIMQRTESGPTHY